MTSDTCPETNGSKFSWPVHQDNMALGYRTNSEDEVAKISHFYPCFNNQIKECLKDILRGSKEDCRCWCHFTDEGLLVIFRIWIIESWRLWTKTEVRRLRLWEAPDSKISRLAIIDLWWLFNYVHEWTWQDSNITMCGYQKSNSMSFSYLCHEILFFFFLTPPNPNSIFLLIFQPFKNLETQSTTFQ